MYRRSFGPSYQEVTSVLRERLRLEPTGRTKSNISILQKLRRETSIRLSQMQDIEGCRIVLPDYEAQEVHVNGVIPVLFAETTVIDRRERPSHDYRAVHIVVSVDGRPVEIQVRTALQHLWAELSEKVADELNDPTVKYGGGSAQVRDVLARSSQRVAEIESLERGMFRLDAEMDYRPSIAATMPEQQRADIGRARDEIKRQKGQLMSILRESVLLVQRAKLRRDKP
jgi:ppGpp synthetase/RelA/SpoT-type nucleotidyltranferase